MRDSLWKRPCLQLKLGWYNPHLPVDMLLCRVMSSQYVYLHYHAFSSWPASLVVALEFVLALPLLSLSLVVANSCISSAPWSPFC